MRRIRNRLRAAVDLDHALGEVHDP
jgi:hypothetical protein